MNQPLRVRASRVRLGRDDYRVLRPARPPLRAFLHDDRRWALAMYADRAAVHVLATAWALATRSRHSLVYLPIRTNTPPDGLHDVPEPLDIVLMHHSAHLLPLLTNTPTDANHHLCAEINAGRWGEVSGGTCAALLHVEYNDTWKL
ncbi:hypothetical protein [Nonomuraea sp. NPDC046570]|uniref:hypothetical protein n=1 Tax=Nonomuraea sp. NPDC046570 TaxID=3155255 RepID=UPI0033C57A2E